MDALAGLGAVQVEFVDALPKTATGKILWRQLQEEENRKAS